MPTPTVTHMATVTENRSLLTGRTFQAHCADCGYRGPHVETPHRANEIVIEHANRQQVAR